MWHVEMLWFDGAWVRMPGMFNSRGEAEWAVGHWKQKNNMTGDPFRYVKE